MDIFKIAELVFGFGGILEQSGFDEKARKGAEERFNEQLGLTRGLKGRVLPAIEKLGKEQMQLLEGSGVQEKKDIQRRWSDRQKGAQTNLTQRGFGNTTIGASMAKGFGEFEEDDLGRLNERIRQEKMQTHGYWGLLGQQMDVDLTGQEINIQGGYAVPPQQSILLPLSELAGRFVKPPEPPEAPGTDIATPLITGGIGAGATLLATAGGGAAPVATGIAVA